ncbi:ThiF family adenylyltransferase [Acidovorax sp. Leaf78]|uniref:tRNA threonylcarbamoyladenosine dehydratase n=1 Tax=unclassified Acidovorax TaxID=2684926 RepID=UPI0006F89231|nr:tRNA threonylcarbamoyladenosine dehydratase [Acidovorax sp. Leaf78]KQO23306.1 heme biosynthesis protein HemY [Acidovorax sp. Leaf78]RZJ59343.1 MAG: tRNA threonylcarbamoyladenosine dehydratase [Acidovorax sp.]
MIPEVVASPDAVPAAELERRFGGLERLYGVAGAARIRQAHVAVIGVGGVGSWTAEALARSGVGQITLVDMDHVAESNINRQIHALTATVGQAKVVAMQQRIAQINPACTVHCVDDFATPENWPGLLPHAVDAVVDACDQVKAKTAMAAWARDNGVLHIVVGAAGGKRHAHKVDVDDLANTTHDPLLAQVRYRLRKEHRAPREGKKIGVTCVFSRESVAAPDASCNIDGDGSLNCHGYGSVVAVTATFGQCAAGWVLDQLAAGSPKKLPKKTL